MRNFNTISKGVSKAIKVWMCSIVSLTDCPNSILLKINIFIQKEILK